MEARATWKSDFSIGRLLLAVLPGREKVYASLLPSLPTWRAEIEEVARDGAGNYLLLGRLAPRSDASGFYELAARGFPGFRRSARIQLRRGRSRSDAPRPIASFDLRGGTRRGAKNLSLNRCFEPFLHRSRSRDRRNARHRSRGNARQTGRGTKTKVLFTRGKRPLFRERKPLEGKGSLPLESNRRDSTERNVYVRLTSISLRYRRYLEIPPKPNELISFH